MLAKIVAAALLAVGLTGASLAAERSDPPKRIRMGDPMATGMMKGGMKKGDVRRAAERKAAALKPMVTEEEKSMPSEKPAARPAP